MLLDERDVAPCLRTELLGVVVGVARPLHPMLRDDVPLLARDLARLAADADRGVGEEADPLLRLRPVRRDGAHVERSLAGSCTTVWRASPLPESACARSASTNSTSA